MSGQVSLHASSVALDGKALVLFGPSGSGKSGLALQLMGMGANLISDDLCHVYRADDHLWVKAPENALPLIEARGLGLLTTKLAPECPIALMVDMGMEEEHRLPPFRKYRLLNCEVPLIHKVESDYFASALFQYLKFGRKK